MISCIILSLGEAEKVTIEPAAFLKISPWSPTERNDNNYHLSDQPILHKYTVQICQIFRSLRNQHESFLILRISEIKNGHPEWMPMIELAIVMRDDTQVQNTA